jgi:hypothetical protein
MTDKQFAEIRELRARLAYLDRLADSHREADARLRRAAGYQVEHRPAIDADDPQRERKQAILDAAHAAGFRDPDDALRLLDDREGEPVELVRGLKADKPYLAPTMDSLIRGARAPQTFEPPDPETPRLPTGSADAGNSGRPSPGPRDPNLWLRRAIHRGRYGYDPDPHNPERLDIE